MNCPKCHSYVSGDFCLICNHIIFEKKKPITKIKKVSDKKKLNDALYFVLRAKFLKDNPKCFVYPWLESIECHHKRGKIGKNYLDVSTFLAVSREAHRKIEDNPEWAKEMGYSESRLKTTD